jgi:hypothetical protein
MKFGDFFKPISRPKPMSPTPSTASANGVSLSPGLTINREKEVIPLLNRPYNVQFFVVKRDTIYILLARKYGLRRA